MLFEESTISPEIASDRGYYTARRRSEVPEAFKDYQRRLGLVVPTFSPDGDTTGHQLRPDRPRTPKLKYESPGESGVIVDVHPRARDEVRHGDGDLFVVEGVKKADALLSHGAPAIALTGVWMAHVPKTKPKRLLPCWDHIRLSGRRVFLGFDSDWKRNDNVHAALEWLGAALEERGADVRVAYLEDDPDGCKAGADDFLAAGGTVAELKALCRRFERQDVARIRLSKDEHLRALAADLDHTFWNTQWKGTGGMTTRDVYLKLVEAAKRSGKIHPDGLRVVKAHGPLALEAKISTRTLWKALKRLEEMDLAYPDNENRKYDKAGAFVLKATRAKVSHIDEKQRQERETGKPAQRGNVTGKLQGYDLGDLPLRTPRLRWTQPGWKPSRKTREKYRRGQISHLPDVRERIERLGKSRGAVVDALEVAGGSLSLAELCQALHRKRPRDVRRRLLPLLEESGIVHLDGDAVSLIDGWLDALEAQRQLGKEVEAEEVDRRRYVLKSRAFHNRLRSQEQESRPSRAGLANVRWSRERREAHVEEPRPETHEQTRRIRKLVREGMKEEFAREEVLRVRDDLEPGGSRSPDDWRSHSLDCECTDCVSPAPRYARTRSGS